MTTVLHAFTHAYGTILAPLYLLMADDLKLAGEKQATLVVTVYMLVYCLGSLGSGILADRFDRKWLLGVGLIGNALAILLMGLTQSYPLILALAVVAGLFGTLFHPAANALAPAHYPKHPGLAIGFLGAGAGLGFFAGPWYAGWRAQSAGWQAPLVEAGIFGLVVGIIYMLVAREADEKKHRNHHTARHLSWTLRFRTAMLAIVLGCRDFAGISSITLVSLYLQKAHGLDPKQTGFVLGAMMLIAIVVNPLIVFLTPGRRRLPALVAVLLIGSMAIGSVPWWGVGAVLPLMCVFQTANLGSYAVSDAATLERTPAALRGRVVGLFLMLAGTMASTGPWIMGAWTDAMGPAAQDPKSYVKPFLLLAGMIAFASFGAPMIAWFGRAMPAMSSPPAAGTEPTPAPAISSSPDAL